MSARALWLESRRRGIGGSDAAAILGLDPWRSSLDVWRSKMEPVEPNDDEKFHLELGRLLEPVIAGLYSEETKRETDAPFPAVMQHAKFPEIIGSPDRLTFRRDRVVELKSEHLFADKFGDPGSDQVPDHYVIQACHYMAVADIDRCDIAVLHGGYKFAVYQLRRDQALEDQMLEQLREWWADYVLAGVEPPLDASESWGKYLEHKYPHNRGALIRVDESAENANVLKVIYGVLREAEKLKAHKALLEQAKNVLKSVIADNDGLVGPWGKITWRRCKDSTATRINYEKLIDQLVAGYDIPESAIDKLREDCMETVVTRPGGRRFIAKRAKDLTIEIPQLETITNDDEELTA